jgi:hypothetical protein
VDGKYDADLNIFCEICDMQSVSLMSDVKGSPPDNHPVFIQPSTENHGGSNPTPGAYSDGGHLEAQDRGSRPQGHHAFLTVGTAMIGLFFLLVNLVVRTRKRS